MNYSSEFLRATQEYLNLAIREMPPSGEQRAHAVIAAIDPHLKDLLLLETLRGSVVYSQYDVTLNSKSLNKIEFIKAMRAVFGYSLKFAKLDVADPLFNVGSVTVDCDVTNEDIQKLKDHLGDQVKITTL